ncbi:M12 family metallo-peptidase [Neolewinella sp.]|uniref:M12 family metallo-peptidase n=1 Tax=Neolewinella sp. TaxID=2993543 RepID=UPI003B52C731
MPRRLLLTLLFLLSLAPALPAQTPERMTVEDLPRLPEVTYAVAFHFVALEDGTNFVTDPQDSLVLAHGGHEKLRADVLMYYLLREINGRFRSGLLDYPGTKDTKIRFAYLNGRDEPLRSAFFYTARQPIAYQKDALNIVFTAYRGRSSSPSGSTPGVGSNRIIVYNQLQRYLRGSHDTWTPARVIAHEFGHTRGLDHTFKCDNPCNGIDLVALDECYGKCATNNSGSTTAGVNCHGGSARELMMAYGSQVYLTVCETELLWNYLLAHPAAYQRFGGE